VFLPLRTTRTEFYSITAPPAADNLEGDPMKARLSFAAFAALITVCSAARANAGCVISPDGKSIDVVTDNGGSDEKNCRVSCQVETKIGVVQISCGGHAPPLAKAHSLCSFEKPEYWYEKVSSSEDDCKGDEATSAALSSPTQSRPTR
jgi:hypothetical protein